MLCYRCKTRHTLGENCPVVTPTREDSDMSLTEQSAAERSAPVQPESSMETQHSTESRQTSSSIQEEAEEGDSSAEDGSGSGSDSGSASESDDGDGPASEPEAGPGTSLENSSELPSRENLSAAMGARGNQGQDSQELRTVSPSKENKPENKLKPKKPLNSMWNFPFDPIFRRWYRDVHNIFRITIEDLDLKGDQINLKQLVDLLSIAADILNYSPSNKNEFDEILNKEYNRYFDDAPIDKRPTIEKFDNYLYHWAKKIWPRALDIIFEQCRLRNRALQNS